MYNRDFPGLSFRYLKPVAKEAYCLFVIRLSHFSCVRIIIVQDLCFNFRFPPSKSDSNMVLEYQVVECSMESFIHKNVCNEMCLILL